MMQKRYRYKVTFSQVILYSLFLWLILGCATRGSVSMQSGDHPLRLLQYVATETLPTGKRKVSENGRTYYSNYFTPKGKPKFWQEIKKSRKYRYSATITILGDQRPYTLEFVVNKEVGQKNGSGVMVFSVVGRSKEAAKALLIYFQENLEKSLKDRNVIDDFRVF